MGITEYLNHLKQKSEESENNDEENQDEETSIDESFATILKIKDLINKNKKIEYNLKFKLW